MDETAGRSVVPLLDLRAEYAPLREQVLASRVLSLTVYPEMTEEQRDHVIASAREAITAKEGARV
ncbi:MAG: hypothetical protein HY723_03740 [Chloroflexi bacterium]|nr:hypothetical protein [Chloroflexota bacterium]